MKRVLVILLLLFVACSSGEDVTSANPENATQNGDSPSNTSPTDIPEFPSDSGDTDGGFQSDSDESNATDSEGGFDGVFESRNKSEVPPPSAPGELE